MAMVSPNDMQAAACKAYGFEKPETLREWQLCVNFWAANVAHGLEVDVCLVMRRLFDCPLTKEQVTQIAEYQAKRARHLRFMKG